MSIAGNVNTFMREARDNPAGRGSSRYTSFDYCYNYFYSFYQENKLPQLDSNENLQISCMQIYSFLASWGMLRGSSYLLRKMSLAYFVPLIKVIANADPRLWEIDVPSYNEDSIKMILKIKDDIINALGIENKPSETLVTKIMIAVFASVPAIDTNFRKAFHMTKINEKNLLRLKQFYEDNQNEIDSIPPIYTIDFNTRKETSLRYPKIKLIDMHGFIEGR